MQLTRLKVGKTRSESGKPRTHVHRNLPHGSENPSLSLSYVKTISQFGPILSSEIGFGVKEAIARMQKWAHRDAPILESCINRFFLNVPQTVPILLNVEVIRESPKNGDAV